MKSVMALKVRPGRQSLEKGLLCVFQVISNILLLIEENKGAEPAIGIGPTGIQVCSLLQQYRFPGVKNSPCKIASIISMILKIFYHKILKTS